MTHEEIREKTQCWKKEEMKPNKKNTDLTGQKDIYIYIYIYIYI